MPRSSNAAHVATFAAKGKGVRAGTPPVQPGYGKLSHPVIQLFKSGHHCPAVCAMFTINRTLGSGP